MNPSSLLVLNSLLMVVTPHNKSLKLYDEFTIEVQH